MALGSETVKKVTLELGGKSANIVLEDADMDSAVESRAWPSSTPRTVGLSKPCPPAPEWMPCLCRGSGHVGQAHAISAAWSTEAIRRIHKYLPMVMENGKDLKARHEMLVASTMASWALSAATVGVAHALAHTIGGAVRRPSRYRLRHRPASCRRGSTETSVFQSWPGWRRALGSSYQKDVRRRSRGRCHRGDNRSG